MDDALQAKVEQVVRLVRSKGADVFFCTRNPVDIPEDAAGQLGNRVQHAVRAFTPRDQRAIRAEEVLAQKVVDTAATAASRESARSRPILPGRSPAASCAT